MSSEIKTNKQNLMVIVLGIVMIPVQIILEGFCVSYLWEWFVVPLGAPPINWVWATGIAVLVGHMTHQSMTLLQKREMSFSDTIGVMIVATMSPAIALGVGFIIAHWMPK